MTKRRIANSFMLVVMFLSFGIGIISCTHREVYHIQAIKSFQIPELNNHNPRYVRMATSDSLLYFLDINDSTGIKSYARTFEGIAVTSFRMPADSIYKSDLLGFYFLNSKQQLLITKWENSVADFYSLRGIPINQESNFAPKCRNIMFSEWQDTLYYTTCEAKSSSLPKANQSLYMKPNDKDRQQLKKIEVLPNDRNNSLFRLLTDSNDKKTMAIAEVDKSRIKVDFFVHGVKHKFSIKRKIGIINKSNTNDYPWNIYVGENFIVIRTMDEQDKGPDTDSIYDLHGRYMGKLICTKDASSKLMDIVNDKLIYFNYKTGTVNIDKIIVN